MNLTIKKLTEKDSPFLETLIPWMLDWWGEDEGFSYAKMRAYMQNSIHVDRLPQTFVVLEDDQLIGVYQFSMTDLDVRPDIYPWLINVFVSKDARGRGIMHHIMESVEKEAHNLGFSDLYLFTTHDGLYEKFNWHLVECFDTFIEAKRIQRLYRLSETKNRGR